MAAYVEQLQLILLIPQNVKSFTLSQSNKSIVNTVLQTGKVNVKGKKCESVLTMMFDTGSDNTNNHPIAQVRRNGLKRKLSKDERLGKSYDATLSEIKRLGIIAEISLEEATCNKTMYYQPHYRLWKKLVSQPKLYVCI